jgi:hypothetical protein
MAQVYSIATQQRIDTPRAQEKHYAATHGYKVISPADYLRMLAEYAKRLGMYVSTDELPPTDEGEARHMIALGNEGGFCYVVSGSMEQIMQKAHKKLDEIARETP